MSNRVTELEARPPVLFSALGLLLIAYAWPTWLQHQQFDRIATMEATIQHQTEILSAALGNALPVKMSPDWEGRLEELEATVADPDLWPKDAYQTEEFIDKLSHLISELSPLSESSYFPRLSLVRWAAVAFDGLHRTPAPHEPLDNLAEQIRAIADAKPEAIVSDLDQRLRETAADIANRAEVQLIEETIHQARRYLTSEATTEQDSLASESSIEEIYEILGIYEDDTQRGDEIGDLRTKLQHHLAIREAQQQAEELNGQWAKAKELATNRPAVYETAANMLLGEVSATRAVLALQGIQHSVYDNLEDEIRHAVEEMQDKARREYQRWAMSQIIRFQNRHEEISNSASEDARIFSIDNGGWNDDRFKEVQDAMILHLLPINQVFLDLPVLKRYQREFDVGWNLLDGREEQTSVAIESALTKKRTFHNFK